MKNKSAYTLIELIISLTIISLIFTFGYVSFRDFSRRQALLGVTKSITSDLRYAQQLAITGQKPSGVTCTTLLGYTFTRLTTTTYRIKANCMNVVASTPTIKDITMPLDITISAGTVMFKVLGQGTDLSDPLVFTLTNTKANISQTVTIGVGGDIQ